MSSSASAPERIAESRVPAITTAAVRTRGRILGGDVAAGLVVAALLSAYALLTTGGTDLGPNTWGEIALVAIGAALATTVPLRAAPGPRWGAVTLGLFGALAVLTALSVAWSVQPSDSWLEANRTLSYLAVFGSALGLARLFPERWGGLLGGLAAAATLICAYSLLAKVFPGTLDPSDEIGRVSAPYGYWNAIGLMAALGLPACLWAGARREGAPGLRALSVPAVSILGTVIALSYSRSALIAAGVGLALWFATVPTRLRGAAILAAGLAGAVIPTVWALHSRPFTHDLTSLPARTHAGHNFGWILLLGLALSALAGAITVNRIDRLRLAPAIRRRIGLGLVGLACLIPVGGVVSLASSSRGLTGEVSHLVSQLTNPSSGAGDTPGRVLELGNSRPRYWREGIKVGEHALLGGAGAGGFATASLRYDTSALTAGHAHSFVIQTFADLGLLGLAVSLALLISWALATARAVRPPPGVAAPSLEPERAGLLTLLAVVVTFGVHSSIDWTWFIPGTAAAALVCAGWLAGRGPLAAPVGRRGEALSLARSPGRSAAVLGVATAALLAAWIIWQPLRSADADSAALAAASSSQALSDARDAVGLNPLSVEPLFELSALYRSLGNPAQALAELRKAVRLQPRNPFTWRWLGEFELSEHQPLAAAGALRMARRLYPSSPQVKADQRQAARLASPPP